MQWHLGTIGFAYPHWSDNFYPRGLREADRLAHFANHFDAIELDTTFHAVPSPDVVKRWAGATPPAFRFCLKTPRDVTHATAASEHLLKISTLETMRRFIDAAENLGDKLAVLLLQFPPAFTIAYQATLLRFLDHFTRGPRLAIEFRHENWWTPEVAAELRGRRIAWVAADQSPKHEASGAPKEKRHSRDHPRPIISTSDFLYVRWVGRHGQFPDRRREHFDPTPRLEWWGNRLSRVLEASPNVRDVYAFFDNDFAGHSPTTANRFAQILGLPIRQTRNALSEPTLFSFV
jgi:uncharacterized protein YecE (DUF72 family)